jgi:hypothetical protein
MPSEQFEIEITKTGEVLVQFKDVAGAHVVEYIEVLTRVIGPLKEEQAVAKRYEPESKVGITSANDQTLHRKIKF